jgi:hypothetical protein
MNMNEELSRLNDAEVVRVLAYATEEIRRDLTDAEQGRIASADEARHALSELLVTAQVVESPLKATDIVPESGNLVAHARAALRLLLEDAATRAKVVPLIANPPRDTQKSIEHALEGAVVLGALVTWLQTHVRVKVERKNGRTHFLFEMRKAPTQTEFIKDLAQKIWGALFLK